MSEKYFEDFRTLHVEKLVDWKNPPTVEDLQSDLTEALPSHSVHKTKVDNWLKLLEGKLKTQPIKGRSRVQPKLIRKQAEWRYAAMEEPFLSTNDMYKVAPVTALDKEASWQNQLILNKQFRTDIPKVRFINKYVRTAVDTGTVIMKLGWKVETGKVREEVEIPVYASPEETLYIINQQLQNGEITPEEAQAMVQSGEPLVLGVEYEEQIVEKEIINSPVVEIKDSRAVIIDPSCEGDIDKAQFIIDRFTTDLSTLKKDGRYKNLDAIRPSDNSPIQDSLHINDMDSSFLFKDKPRQKITVYEYWGFWDIDGTGETKAIVASFIGTTMIRLEENPFPDKKFPFVIIQYLPVTTSVYGEPDAALLEDNQDILGALMRGTLDLMGRSANSQLGIRKDALDSLNLIKFREGKDYEFNPHVQADQVFFMNKYPEIPRSALELMNIQNNEAESITGVKAFTGGISGKALGDSVGGIRSALDATAKRELGILRRLAQGLVDLGKKIMAMNAVWLSDEEIIRITDEEFVAIKRDDLAGNFDLSLDVSTAESDNQKAAELAFMLQTTGNSMPFDVTRMILVEIARLRKMPELAQTMKEYQPQPDPMAVKMQELQLALLEAQVFNERAKAAENETDVSLKQQKTAVEAAKAKKLGAEADLSDLKYVEQSMGVQQDRELEKIYANQTSKVAQLQQASQSKGYLDNRK